MSAAQTVTATFATGVTPLTVTALTANKTTPQPVGTLVTFTATASGGTAPYQYRWVVYNGSTWAVGQEWSTSNTFAWTPSVAAPHNLQVWVRSAGSTVAYPPEAWRGQDFLVTP